MPKAQALALTQRLKRWLIGGAIAAFVTLSGLAAAHATGVTAAQAGSSGNGSDGNSAQPSNNDDGGGFFGPSNSGPSFGSGGSQSPISGTSTS